MDLIAYLRAPAPSSRPPAACSSDLTAGQRGRGGYVHMHVRMCAHIARVNPVYHKLLLVLFRPIIPPFQCLLLLALFLGQLLVLLLIPF